MGRVFFISPHPDDETLSMGIAMLYYLAAGYEVHLVSMSRGGALGVANTLNGVQGCSAASLHPYTHKAATEGYPADFTVEMVGEARLREARSALGSMGMIPPNSPTALGTVVHHDVNLPSDWGCGGCSSSTTPATEAGIQQAYDAIKELVDQYPNSFFHTMSETDNHHDHHACGFALRRLKNSSEVRPSSGGLTYAQSLVNARFFVSRLYWASSQPDGQYPDDVASMPDLKWFNAGARLSEFQNWMKNQVQKPYRAWNPAAGSYAIGYHQVASQFEANLGPSASVACLWHA